MKPFRVIDTGLREGRRQIAFDQALIDLHKAGQVPDTIRFLRFPPTALIGRHQALSREVRHERRVQVIRVRKAGPGAFADAQAASTSIARAWARPTLLM